MACGRRVQIREVNWGERVLARVGRPRGMSRGLVEHRGRRIVEECRGGVTRRGRRFHGGARRRGEGERGNQAAHACYEGLALGNATPGLRPQGFPRPALERRDEIGAWLGFLPRSASPGSPRAQRARAKAAYENPPPQALSSSAYHTHHSWGGGTRRRKRARPGKRKKRIFCGSDLHV